MSFLSSDAWYNFGCCAALTLSNVLKEANSGKSDNHHLIWQERSRRLPGIVYTNKLNMPGTVLGCRGQMGGSTVKLALLPEQEGLQPDCSLGMGPPDSTRLCSGGCLLTWAETTSRDQHGNFSLWSVGFWCPVGLRGTSSVPGQTEPGGTAPRATLNTTRFLATQNRFSCDSAQRFLLKTHKYSQIFAYQASVTTSFN